jgi:hypothetical protein
MQTSGASCREIEDAYSVVIVRLVRNCALGRTIQYSRDVSDGIEKPQRTGYPAFAGYDSMVCGAAVRYRLKLLISDTLPSR